jgi:8-oxo-dGTP pyrophosphatase MutT (NUDIX family)
MTITTSIPPRRIRLQAEDAGHPKDARITAASGRRPAAELRASNPEGINQYTGKTKLEKSDREELSKRGLFLHGTSHNFSEFKPGGHGAIYLSDPSLNTDRTTQAEHIASGPFGGRLIGVKVDDSKLKKFDQYNDPVAKKIFREVYPNPDTHFIDYTDMPKIVEKAGAHGYNDFRVYEPSVQSFSRAITEPNALKVVELGKIKNEARRAVSQHPLEAAAGPLPGQIERVIVSLQNDGRLPIRIPPETMRHVAESLARYFQTASQDKIEQFAEAAKAAVEAELKTENVQTVETMKADTTGVNVGATPATSRAALSEFIESATGENIGQTMNMDFFNRIMREVTQGAGNFVAQNFDQTRLDEFPALELHRVYDREVPRGFKVGKGGAILPDPDNDWPSRWEAAGGELVDGRMVALKSDPIWQALGDGEGGYEDTLGNPFAPFAFNSGFDTDEVSRDDAVALGLMDDEDEAKPADFDFKSLLNIEAASAAVRSPLQAAAGDVPLVAKCFITDADGRLLVLQADGYGRMDLPGGHLRAGETVEDGLRREVLEETGLTLTDVKELGTVMVPWEGGRPIVFFSAQSDDDEAPVLSDEHVDWFWLNRHEVALRNFSALNKVVNNFMDGKDLNEA